MISKLVSYGQKYLVASSQQRFLTTLSDNGQMRHMNGRVEVNDGYNWMPYENEGYVGLTPEAIQILDWAKIKMMEDIIETEMIKKYPALKTAKDKFDLIKQFCKAEEDLDKQKQI